MTNIELCGKMFIMKNFANLNTLKMTPRFLIKAIVKINELLQITCNY